MPNTKKIENKNRMETTCKSHTDMANQTTLINHDAILYDRLITSLNYSYNDSVGEQRDWIESNWISILDGMIERYEEMVNGWKEDEGGEEEEKEKAVELFKVAKAECPDTEYFETLEDAKTYIDKYRESHDLDYGYIMRVEKDGESEEEIGEWGEFWEEWER